MRNSIADTGQWTDCEDMQLPCPEWSCKSACVNAERGHCPGDADTIRDGPWGMPHSAVIIGGRDTKPSST